MVANMMAIMSLFMLMRVFGIRRSPRVRLKSRTMVLKELELEAVDETEFISWLSSELSLEANGSSSEGTAHLLSAF